MQATKAFVLVSSLFVCVTTLSACAESEVAQLDAIRNEIRTTLSIGDSSERIEHYLRGKGAAFDFDPLANPARYQCVIRNVGVGPFGKKAIQIYIYVDEKKTFTSAEVIGIYE